MNLQPPLSTRYSSGVIIIIRIDSPCNDFWIFFS